MIYRSLCTASAFALLIAAALPASAQTTDKSNWSGWYLGATAGGNWGDGSHHFFGTSGNGALVLPPADVTSINALSTSKGNGAGFAGAIEGGYDYRSTSVLAGIETDIGFLNLDQSRSGTFQSAITQPIVPPPPPVNVTIGQKTTTDWLWTIRPRLGYITGNWLLYATGGLALADVKLMTAYSDTAGNAATNSHSSTKTGWTLGAGVGYALSHAFSIKAEYLYVDLGTVSSTAIIPNGYGSLTSTTEARSHLIRAGIDYHF
jgi:outer membrane immunogenic protein